MLWKMGYNHVLNPVDMSTDHLYNSLKLVYNNLVELDGLPYAVIDKTFTVLKDPVQRIDILLKMAEILRRRHLDLVRRHKINVMESYIICRPKFIFGWTEETFNGQGEW